MNFKLFSVVYQNLIVTLSIQNINDALQKDVSVAYSTTEIFLSWS